MRILKSIEEELDNFNKKHDEVKSTLVTSQNKISHKLVKRFLERAKDLLKRFGKKMHPKDVEGIKKRTCWVETLSKRSED